MYIPLLVGLVLAVAVAGYASLAKLDRSRAFYSTVLIVVASYYVLFAAVGGSRGALVAETAMMAPFVVLATLGYARSSWLLALGLAAHGLLDVVHGRVIDNPGVPDWWPSFCMGYDVAAALVLAIRLRASSSREALAR
jgi:hypothetical protein